MNIVNQLRDRFMSKWKPQTKEEDPFQQDERQIRGALLNLDLYLQYDVFGDMKQVRFFPIFNLITLQIISSPSELTGHIPYIGVHQKEEQLYEYHVRPDVFNHQIYRPEIFAIRKEVLPAIHRLISQSTENKYALLFARYLPSLEASVDILRQAHNIKPFFERAILSELLLLLKEFLEDLSNHEGRKYTDAYGNALSKEQYLVQTLKDEREILRRARERESGPVIPGVTHLTYSPLDDLLELHSPAKEHSPTKKEE